MRILGTSLCLVAAFAGGGFAWFQEESEYFAPGSRAPVAHATVQLKRDARFLSPTLAVLTEGTPVEILDRSGSWYRVRADQSGGQEGFVHTSAVVDPRTWKIMVNRGAGTVSYAERTAAARGFNDEIEKRRRQDRPELDQGYAALERALGRTFDEDEIAAFRAAGGLDR